jgi:broad-specificity NMP kinase
MITIVSGLPRSGTSMMMKMLQAGGIKILVDNVREADEDNLNGYFEFEKVKQLDEDTAWLNTAEGKAVKVISYLLRNLPPRHEYKVIFIQRNIKEILASQRRMLARRKMEDDEVPDTVMAAVFERHLEDVYEWLGSQPNIKVHYVSYNEIMRDPEPYVEEINDFLGTDLDIEKMVNVVDPSLYRQRV